VSVCLCVETVLLMCSLKLWLKLNLHVEFTDLKSSKKKKKFKLTLKNFNKHTDTGKSLRSLQSPSSPLASSAWLSCWTYLSGPTEVSWPCRLAPCASSSWCGAVSLSLSAWWARKLLNAWSPSTFLWKWTKSRVKSRKLLGTTNLLWFASFSASDRLELSSLRSISSWTRSGVCASTICSDSWLWLWCYFAPSLRSPPSSRPMLFFPQKTTLGGGARSSRLPAREFISSSTLSCSSPLRLVSPISSASAFIMVTCSWFLWWSSCCAVTLEQ